MRFKDILFPIDFSDSSKSVFKELVNTQEFKGANIYLLNVVDGSSVYMYYGDAGVISANFVKEMTDLADKHLSQFKEEFFYEKPSDHITTHVRTGSTAEEITEFAKENSIDLIAMPTHARKGVSRFFMGSVTEEVLRLAPCPVLTLKMSSE